MAAFLLCTSASASADPPVATSPTFDPGILSASSPPVMDEVVLGQGWGRWARSSAVGLRIDDTAIRSSTQVACNLRLERTDALPDDPPLLEWVGRSDSSPDGTGRCTGIQPSGTYDLSGTWPTGTTRLELRASSELHPTEPGRLVADFDLDVDDVAPVVSWPDTPDRVPGGTRVKVLPEWFDVSGVRGTAIGITDDLGKPYVFEQQGGGTLVVPAGRTIIVDAYITDMAGNTAHEGKMVHGIPAAPGPPAPPVTVDRPTPRTPAAECAGARRAALTAATWNAATGRLSVSGCRAARRTLALQVRVRRHGRSATSTYALARGGPTFGRTVRLVTGARAVRVRVGRAKTWGAWRPASVTRQR